MASQCGICDSLVTTKRRVDLTVFKRPDVKQFMRLHSELSRDATAPKTKYACRSCQGKFSYWLRQKSQTRVQVRDESSSVSDSSQPSASTSSASTSSASTSSASTSSTSTSSASTSNASNQSDSVSYAASSASQTQDTEMMPPPSVASTSSSTRRRSDLHIALAEQNEPRRPSVARASLDEDATPFVQPPTVLNKYRKVECPRLSCIFGCRWPGRANVRNLFLAERTHLLKTKYIYVPPNSRICKHHDFFSSVEFIEQLYLTRQFTVEDIEDVFSFISSMQERFCFRRCDDIPDEIARRWTSLTMRQLIELSKEINLESDIVFPERALACYLAKLRTGDSWERIFDVIGVPNSTGYNYVSQVRLALKEQFVPKYIGLANITRNTALSHVTRIASGLLADYDNEKMIVICDGTYVYHQKSAHYPFQRASYSPHKFTNLFKPMIFCMPDGWILEVTGPYSANQSDSTIMQDMLNTEDFKNFFQQNDIFVLDRGFRYVSAKLECSGYKVFMPALKAKKQKQFTTEQANDSRIVTKVRYAVEDVNGRVKSTYRQFTNVWQNKALDHAFDDFKIACALLNKFGSRLESDKEIDFDLVAEMKSRNVKENPMSSILSRFKRYTADGRQWINLDAESLLPSFPVLTYTQLMHFTLGSYQLHQALGYYAEHSSPEGSFYLQVYKDILRVDLSGTGIRIQDPDLIRVRLQSRHSNATKYLAYVLYDKSEPTNIHYICQCASGTRTIGCCAHIATVIWYLGYGRHQPTLKIVRPPMSTLTIRHESDDEDEEQAD
uniref:DDE Tnp4 domain-containing protein n=1 Tax=Tetranychus urticae TaxID=32264 RepID=T1KG68_TETUR